MKDAVQPLDKGGGRLTKGERTRRRLMDATREMLAEHGYRDMRIEDIARAADVAKGTFYIYFENKAAITMEVLREAVDDAMQAMRDARTEDDPFLEILEPTVMYLQTAFENARLMRALLQFSHNEPEAARLLTENNQKWVAQIAVRMDRRLGRGAVAADTRTLVTYAMTWMVDGVLNSYLARDDARLQEVIPTPEQLGEILSVLWYRAVYGEDPDAVRLENARAILDFRLQRES